ncbi:MAG: uracil-DNA glycosylase [Candidatus Diapherotrites archaeon]|nr:uracil-DNA glycosylase [Candidatus Diapherotrites archaeon]
MQPHNNLEELRAKVENCKRCSLWKTRKKVVFGEGPENASVFLIGLGPGHNENLQGKPFVGLAGKFLNHLLALAGLNRKEVYITSVMKCYLPENRATKEQIKTCKHYLDVQLEIIKPKIIVPLGNVALQYVAEKFNIGSDRISKIHGKLFNAKASWGKVKIVPMYHPAAALRNGGLRKMLETDWRRLRELLKNS